MLNPEILLVADTATAIILALSFLTAYLVASKLAVFRWWAACYALLAVPIGTASIRIETPFVWINAVSAVCLYGAVSLAAFGMYKEGHSRDRPHVAIAAGAVLLAVIVVTLIALDAPPVIWIGWGIVPTIAFTLWSAMQLLRQRPCTFVDWGYGLALLGGAVLIAARAAWFTNLLLWPHLFIPFSGSLTDQAVILSLITIFAMIVLAAMLFFRVFLAAIWQMRERSATDTMTGLLNRATFDEQAAQVLRSACGKPICAVMMDIDHFKRVNDTLGHPAGDRVISLLGEVIRQAVDGGMIAGRIGGEEFAVILPGANLGAARLLAEAIRNRFSACSPDADISWTVTLSAGVAMRADAEPLHALLARADKALYAAKNRGRNCVVTEIIEPVDAVSVQRA